MPSNQPPPNPLQSITIAGRILIIATIVVGGATFVWNMLFIHENFPAGQYPIAFIMIPVVMFACVFFGLGAVVFRVLDIRFWRKYDDDGHNSHRGHENEAVNNSEKE
jgi:hypothetical protein